MNYDDIIDGLYPEWHARALCNGMSPELWFPSAATAATRRDATAEARSICRKCPVRRQCADDAKARRATWGVWGGLDFEIRRPKDSNAA